MWSAKFALQNDDETPMNITGKSFTFVARPTVTNRSAPPQVEVNSAFSTAQGEINIDLLSSTIEVVVTSSANSGWSGGTFTLWMNPNLADATALVQGPYLLQPTTIP